LPTWAGCVVEIFDLVSRQNNLHETFYLGMSGGTGWQ
jgi:hypothetical protein